MILPDGTLLWKNLKISFVDIDELYLHLKKKEFTGFIHFDFINDQGVVLFQEGDVINGIMEKGERRICGQESVKSILNSARLHTTGSISVTKLPEETLGLFSSVFRTSAKLLYKNLSSEFSHLGQFVGKLVKSAFSGFIEIRFPMDDKRGIIHLEKGNIEAILTEKLNFRLNQGVKSDTKFIHSFIEGAQSMGVLYDAFVYV